MITGIILTKNEEENIIGCINSIDWCDEIIIIDDYSTDNTIQKIEKLNKKNIVIYKRKLNGNFAAQRNFGLNKASSEWVFFVDADERVSESLQYEILSSINSGLDSVSGYFLKRTDYMWGKKLNFGETRSVKLLRLGRKESGIWQLTVHEEWEIKGRCVLLKSPILHYPHPNLSEFLKEINYYSDLRAYELYRSSVKPHVLHIISYPILKFILNYFIRLGMLDGMPGLIHAILMSFHSFLVRSKLWKLWEEK